MVSDAVNAETLAVARDSEGGQGRVRTADPRFFRPVLYQLSYLTGSM
jgi:hypothetical protein